MAGYQDWMNPNPQTTHMDMLLNNPAAGILGERMQTRERVEPQWNLPWQGNADFVTDIPGNPGVDPLRRENMMIPPPMRNRYPAEFDPATGQMRLQKEEVPQTQRPARPVVPFPEGESLNKTPIANSFMDRIKELFTPGGEDHGREFNVPETPQAWHPQFRSPSSPAYKTYGHPKMAY